MGCLNNFFLICLNEDFGKEASKMLARKLAISFLDCSQFVKDDLFNRKVTRENADIDFLKKQEHLALKECISRLGVHFVGYDAFKHNHILFKNNTTYYLKLPLKFVTDPISKIAFESRDRYLQNSCEIIELNSLEESEMEKIVLYIGE